MGDLLNYWPFVLGLLATGGSTNHTMHLIAIANAAGLKVTWDDMSALSDAVPLLARVYPNGLADVNHFHAAGGMGLVIGQLLRAGLLHADVTTAAGPGLARYTQEPCLDQGRLAWRAGVLALAPADAAGLGRDLDQHAVALGHGADAERDLVLLRDAERGREGLDVDDFHALSS